jgi:hypothetical protein
VAVTTQELLDSVEAAILALTNGQAQSYLVDGVAFTRTDLDKLKSWRRELRSELIDGQGGARTRVSFPRGC